IRETLTEIDRTLSAWNTRSELSALNDDRRGDWLLVSDPLYAVLDAARAVNRQTSGAFDVTVAPLVAVWGFGADAKINVEAPSDAQIQEARALVGSTMLALQAPRHAAPQRPRHGPTCAWTATGLPPVMRATASAASSQHSGSAITSSRSAARLDVTAAH